MTERTFRLVGHADVLAVPGIARDLDEVIRICDEELIVDCHDLEFIDSTGIGVLVRARDDLDGKGCRLRIVNMPPMGRRAIEAVGLTEYLGFESGSAR